MSGYAGDLLDEHGITEKTVRFLRKPFDIGELLRRVYDILEENSTDD